MEKLLLFNLSNAAAIEAVAGKLRMRTAIIPPEQHTICIGTLAGYAMITPVKTVADTDTAAVMPPEGMLVMCGLKNSRLDRLLTAFHRAGIVIPYKAILTPSNAGWTALRLAQELIREHRAISGDSAS